MKAKSVKSSKKSVKKSPPKIPAKAKAVPSKKAVVPAPVAKKVFKPLFVFNFAYDEESAPHKHYEDEELETEETEFEGYCFEFQTPVDTETWIKENEDALEETRESLEADFAPIEEEGSKDSNYIVIGYNSTQVPKSDSKRLVKAWHEFFVEKLGADKVGDICTSAAYLEEHPQAKDCLYRSTF